MGRARLQLRSALYSSGLGLGRAAHHDLPSWELITLWGYLPLNPFCPHMMWTKDVGGSPSHQDTCISADAFWRVPPTNSSRSPQCLVMPGPEQPLGVADAARGSSEGPRPLEVRVEAPWEGGPYYSGRPGLPPCSRLPASEGSGPFLEISACIQPRPYRAPVSLHPPSCSLRGTQRVQSREVGCVSFRREGLQCPWQLAPGIASHRGTGNWPEGREGKSFRAAVFSCSLRSSPEPLHLPQFQRWSWERS